jgi:hypothetical protein
MVESIYWEYIQRGDQPKVHGTYLEKIKQEKKGGRKLYLYLKEILSKNKIFNGNRVPYTGLKYASKKWT